MSRRSPASLDVAGERQGLIILKNAQVVELVYTPVLGTGRAICGGSSPLLGTKILKKRTRAKGGRGKIFPRGRKY